MTPKQRPRDVFCQRVWADGYRLARGRLDHEAEPADLITHTVMAEYPRGVLTVEIPPDAYLQFATSCHSPSAALAFANRYGFLGVGDHFEFTWDEPNPPSGYEVAERVSVWLYRAEELRVYWEFWQQVESDEPETAGASIDWLMQQGEMFVEQPLGIPTRPDDRPPTIPRTPADTPARIAADDHASLGYEYDEALKAWLDYDQAVSDKARALTSLDEARQRAAAARHVGGYLYRDKLRAEHASLKSATRAISRARAQARQATRLCGMRLLGLMVTKRLRLFGVVPSLEPFGIPPRARSSSARAREMALVYTTPTLLGALWLQFALAISTSVRYRRCPGCGTFLTIHPDSYRTNRKSCGDACRQRLARSTRKARRQPRTSRRPQAPATPTTHAGGAAGPRA